MLELVFLLPFCTGTAALFLPVHLGRIVLVASALLHLQVSVLCWLRPFTPALPGYFGVSSAGLLVLLMTSGAKTAKQLAIMVLMLLVMAKPRSWVSVGINSASALSLFNAL